MTDQPLMELTGEQGDAIDASVVAEPVASDAHLSATATEQHLPIEVGPGVNGLLAGD